MNEPALRLRAGHCLVAAWVLMAVIRLCQPTVTSTEGHVVDGVIARVTPSAGGGWSLMVIQRDTAAPAYVWLDAEIGRFDPPPAVGLEIRAAGLLEGERFAHLLPFSRGDVSIGGTSQICRVADAVEGRPVFLHARVTDLEIRPTKNGNERARFKASDDSGEIRAAVRRLEPGERRLLEGGDVILCGHVRKKTLQVTGISAP